MAQPCRSFKASYSGQANILVSIQGAVGPPGFPGTPGDPGTKGEKVSCSPTHSITSFSDGAETTVAVGGSFELSIDGHLMHWFFSELYGVSQ